jgi:hypothetical protein
MIFTFSALSGFHSIMGSVALQLTLFLVNVIYVRPTNVEITANLTDDK